jgi:23S rRNA (cytosine1962-C5)-methyltransferase
VSISRAASATGRARRPAARSSGGYPALTLKAGREKSLLRRHPWIFSGAIERFDGEPQSGQAVAVRASSGAFLAWAAYSAGSQIRARVWSWQEDEPPGEGLLRARIARAIALRGALYPGADAVRLVNAESDALPGLIVDRYGDTLVLQASSAGAAYWRDVAVGTLLELVPARGVYERSDAEVMELEGLPARAGVLHGDEPADPVVIAENGLSIGVRIAAGHKTGFYLDQRENRLLLRQLAREREVLDCFCYTGGFALNALAGGARHVTAVDASGEALDGARRNAALNGLADERIEWLNDDAFKLLRRLRDQGRQFDLIVLDPPKFAPTAALAERAARGYKDINLLAFKLLRPGGQLMTFSCSGGISRELFQKIVAGAASDARVDAQIVRWLSAAPDHPVALAFPEGEYLKGLLCHLP